MGVTMCPSNRETKLEVMRATIGIREIHCLFTVIHCSFTNDGIPRPLQEIDIEAVERNYLAFAETIPENSLLNSRFFVRSRRFREYRRS